MTNADKEYEWLNEKRLEYVKNKDERDAHKAGALLVSDFWRKHKEITICDLEKRAAPHSNFALEDKDNGCDREIYALTLLDGNMVVCKRFRPIRASSSLSGHVGRALDIQNTYKVSLP